MVINLFSLINDLIANQDVDGSNASGDGLLRKVRESTKWMKSALNGAASVLFPDEHFFMSLSM